jgi:hypothetical protein
MISIIISSINPTLLNQLSENIEKTIGVEYEIISHNNYKSNWGICKVYNHCAEKAKYENLVFCHEDILFHTQNWAEILLNYLNNEEIGLIGVAGGIYKSKFHSSWWVNLIDINLQRINIIQHSKNISHIDFINPKNEKFSNVVAIDGVFMACRKHIWENNIFDENNFSKFHFYDLDFSFQISQTHKVVVVYDILIEHFSIGSYDKDWVHFAKVFTYKWRRQLPKSNVELNSNNRKKLEQNAHQFYLNTLISNRCILLFFKYYIYYILKYPFHKSGIAILKNYFMKILRK